jgi:UTP-glucose-1-phosphate uridylyltransferase
MHCWANGLGSIRCKGLTEKVVIPAAGLGTTLLSSTKEQPKEMLPVFSHDHVTFLSSTIRLEERSPMGQDRPMILSEQDMICA